jgi:hypothetical protein
LISEVTRRALFSDLLKPGRLWFGELDETEFLSRIYDLKTLPSGDPRFVDAAGDIWQHRVNNPEDWPDDWLLSDARFNLLHGDDAVFLRFLEEVIHPAVRDDGSVRRIWTVFNDRLSVDGWEFLPVELVSGRIRYAPRRKAVGTLPEQLLLDFRSGGSSTCQVGERLDQTLERDLIDRARTSLAASGETDALRLLNRFPFAVRRGTNSFGDYFYALTADVSSSTFAQQKAAASSGDDSIKRAAAGLRTALNRQQSGHPEFRFVVLMHGNSIVCGLRGEYVYEDEHFDSGGFAHIHRARSAQGEVLALKRLHARDDEAVARLRREIQEQSRIRHRAVMPIVDHDPRFEWFVMPLADENLAERWRAGPIADDELLELLEELANGLGAAHALGLVHRDVSQRNVLRLGAQWVVADWGVVRRPPGFTTMVRTQGELGTQGFAAPELFRTAHDAGPPADIYSLGRIAAWVVTREWPEQNVPLLPSGPWRYFVRRTTEHEPGRRPQTMAEVVELLRDVARELREGSNDEPSPSRAVDNIALLDECLLHPENHELYLDRLHHVDEAGVMAWLQTRAQEVGVMISQFERHLINGSAWAPRSFDDAGTRIAFVRRVALCAARVDDHGLLEDCAGSLLRAEAHWQRFTQRRATRAWIESLSGAAARTVARVMRREVAGTRWLLEEGWLPVRTDPAILQATKDVMP